MRVRYFHGGLLVSEAVSFSATDDLAKHIVFLVEGQQMRCLNMKGCIVGDKPEPLDERKNASGKRRKNEKGWWNMALT